MMSNPWEVLGLEVGTPMSEVRARWRFLLRTVHPDANGGVGDTELSMIYQAAYRQISEYGGGPDDHTIPVTLMPAGGLDADDLEVLFDDPGPILDGSEDADEHVNGQPQELHLRSASDDELDLSLFSDTGPNKRARGRRKQEARSSVPSESARDAARAHALSGLQIGSAGGSGVLTVGRIHHSVIVIGCGVPLRLIAQQFIPVLNGFSVAMVVAVAAVAAVIVGVILRLAGPESDHTAVIGVVATVVAVVAVVFGDLAAYGLAPVAALGAVIWAVWRSRTEVAQ